ncbi:DNA-binding transcriptional regulator, AcrR family [Actinokineospora alba]|uniref:DNA-binding transcriptional regulator, AcrR family n=1 Tax=Actinokineospora alba TaxID=504798 RepID=A0A1H0HRY4_9PSEU|nr:TetR/AcrR family transcriptional regulator [Actinokineospora alba]TDP64772.1 TetR family transcriptional regulator [Actinokineospora alba]SDH45635.1 DNA-binding transcriptional regulator, AcrR family [Actinokineospora alba]SDO21909.1 DNA-binding transcriptional regulator, AcrR family [Actinokineospora alba]
MGQVKGKRRYDSSGRQEQARRSREAILEAAERQFLDQGYARTTVSAIAGAAGVSVETVYKAFGGKAGLVQAIYERGLTGRGTVPAYQRSDEMRAQETDPETIMRKWGVLTAEVASLVTPIRLLMRAAAATDPEMATLLRAGDDERLERMRHHARFLDGRGWLRADVTLAEATDVLWTCSSAELYELLVMKRGWPLSRFARFVTDFMISSLLPADR